MKIYYNKMKPFKNKTFELTLATDFGLDKYHTITTGGSNSAIVISKINHAGNTKTIKVYPLKISKYGLLNAINFQFIKLKIFLKLIK